MYNINKPLFIKKHKLSKFDQFKFFKNPIEFIVYTKFWYKTKEINQC